MARVLPSGLNATEILDRGAGDRAGADLLPGGQVPQLGRAVAVAGGQGLAVRGERHRSTMPAPAVRDAIPGDAGGAQHCVVGLSGGIDAPCGETIKLSDGGVGVTEGLALLASSPDVAALR